MRDLEGVIGGLTDELSRVLDSLSRAGEAAHDECDRDVSELRVFDKSQQELALVPVSGNTSHALESQVALLERSWRAFGKVDHEMIQLAADVALTEMQVQMCSLKHAHR